MEIISSLNLKKNNNKFLMKQEQLKLALSKLFYSKKIKWILNDNARYAHLVNISKIILTKDYSRAQVFINLYKFVSEKEGQVSKVQEIANNLNQEAWLIKKCLGKELALRKYPNLFFKVDTKGKDIDKVVEIIDNLKYSTSNDG